MRLSSSSLSCFFRQKTAYEVRISDCSSDVCSSDLAMPPIIHAERESGKPIRIKPLIEVWTLAAVVDNIVVRSEEHTSELQSLMRRSYAVFCLKKKNRHQIGQEQLGNPFIYLQTVVCPTYY